MAVRARVVSVRGRERCQDALLSPPGSLDWHLMDHTHARTTHTHTHHTRTTHHARRNRNPTRSLWPALMIFACLACMPDTPAALIERGKVAEGRQALQQIRGPWWVAWIDSWLVGWLVGWMGCQ
jgi:hypothetical protein